MKDILTLFVLGIVFSAVSGISLIDTAFPIEPVVRGETAEIYVSAYTEPGDDEFEESRTIKNLRIGAYWLDLGLIDMTSESNLEDGGVWTTLLTFDIPLNAHRGWHPIYVWMYGDNGARDGRYIFTYVR
ncbi:hypothetical protein GOV09_05865 [Candidatus Woesearchaeota archaeon]|nr:hypothetical protein [Candidatus Woesearchaeota archaeon]